jgi:hypothetical protein
LKDLYERITELEAEVEYMQQVILAYRDREKDGIAVEIALLLVGLLVGVALGYYAARGFL